MCGGPSGSRSWPLTLIQHQGPYFRTLARSRLVDPKFFSCWDVGVGSISTSEGRPRHPMGRIRCWMATATR